MARANVPGYVYLLESGEWEKVGLAASYARVRDHARHGWTDRDRLVGGSTLVTDPVGLEASVLAKVGGRQGDRGPRCSRCDALKPAVGRDGADGLTEIRHVDCWDSMRPAFEAAYSEAAKVERTDLLELAFDPGDCAVDGFGLVDSWVFPAEPMARTRYNANMVGVRARPSKVLDIVDAAHRRGEVNLRLAVSDALPGRLVRFGGATLTSRWGATGGGGSGSPTGDRSTFETNLGRCIVDGVETVLVHLRSSNSLLAYARHRAELT